MTSSPSHRPGAASATATLVYDGDCAFCSSSARALLRWAPADARVVPFQRTDLAALGLTRAECEQSVRLVTAEGRRAGAAAIAAYLRRANPFWRAVGLALGSRPGLAVAEPVYRWVARNRHRLPGGTPACRLPEG